MVLCILILLGKVEGRKVLLCILIHFVLLPHFWWTVAAVVAGDFHGIYGSLPIPIDACPRELRLRGGSGVSGYSACKKPARSDGMYNRTALLSLADRLRKIDNRPLEALQVYREILQHESGNDIDALGGAAAVLITQQATMAEARVLLDRALLLAPSDARALHAIGVAEWAATRNAAKAAVFFSRAIALDPSHARSRCALANMLESRGNTQQAERVMEQALEQLPSSVEVASDYGSLLAERPDANLSHAETLYRRALSLDPHNVATLYNHAHMRYPVYLNYCYQK